MDRERRVAAIEREVVQGGITIDAAARKQVDLQIVDPRHVPTEFQRVVPVKPTDILRKLQALLVWISGARQEIGHAEVDAVGGAHRWSRRVWQFKLEIAAVLKTQLAEERGSDDRAPAADYGFVAHIVGPVHARMDGGGRSGLDSIG